MTPAKYMTYGGTALAIVMLILMMKGTYSTALFIIWCILAVAGGGIAWWGQQTESRQTQQRLRQERDDR